jgi:hypothetical protein
VCHEGVMFLRSATLQRDPGTAGLQPGSWIGRAPARPPFAWRRAALEHSATEATLERGEPRAGLEPGGPQARRPKTYVPDTIPPSVASA